MALKFHVYSTFGYVTWCFKRSTKALQRPLRLNLSLRNLRGAFSRWDLKSILQFDKQGTSLPRSLPLSLPCLSSCFSLTPTPLSLTSPLSLQLSLHHSLSPSLPSSLSLILSRLPSLPLSFSWRDVILEKLHPVSEMRPWWIGWQTDTSADTSTYTQRPIAKAFIRFLFPITDRNHRMIDRYDCDWQNRLIHKMLLGAINTCMYMMHEH